MHRQEAREGAHPQGDSSAAQRSPQRVLTATIVHSAVITIDEPVWLHSNQCSSVSRRRRLALGSDAVPSSSREDVAGRFPQSYLVPHRYVAAPVSRRRADSIRPTTSTRSVPPPRPAWTACSTIPLCPSVIGPRGHSSHAISTGEDDPAESLHSRVRLREVERVCSTCGRGMRTRIEF